MGLVAAQEPGQADQESGARRGPRELQGSLIREQDVFDVEVLLRMSLECARQVRDEFAKGSVGPWTNACQVRERPGCRSARTPQP